MEHLWNYTFYEKMQVRFVSVRLFSIAYRIALSVLYAC